MNISKHWVRVLHFKYVKYEIWFLYGKSFFGHLLEEINKWNSAE